MTVNVVYRVGSMHEGQGESGMAHLLEHLLFKGTPTHPDIPVMLGRRGVRWNGTTSHERTNYFSSFNASDETLALVLRLEADRMLNSRIAKDDLVREMPVVRNEFERADSQGFDVELKNQSNAELVMFTNFALKQLGPDFMPLLLATHILGGGTLDNRLADRIRQREGLSYGVGAHLQSNYFDDRSQLRIQGSFAPENRDRMLAAVNEELARALREGFTEAELQRARTSLLEQRRRNRAQDEVLASELLWHFEVGKTFIEMSDNDARLQAVTLPQLAETLRRYIDPAGFVTGVAGSFQGKVQNPPRAAP